MKRLNSLLNVAICAGLVSGGLALVRPPAAVAADKEHEHKKGEEHKGEKKELGKASVAGFEISATQIGDVKAGKEAIFVLKAKGQGEPKGVRAWVGPESGEGVIKTKAEEEEHGEWHAHHEVADPIPAGAKLWVEVEGTSGKKKGSFALK